MTTNHKFQAGKIILDTSNCKASVGNKIVHLTSREYEILEYLIKHANEVIPRKKILEEVWGDGLDGFSNVIDVHIKNLRKKIKARNSASIETIRSVGYRLKTS